MTGGTPPGSLASVHAHWPLATLALLLTLWLGVRLVRRRMARGEATEVERRFDDALRRFHVEIDRFKFTRQGAVKVLLNHDHAIWTEVERIALATPSDRNLMRLKVYRYTEEIVPFFRPLSYYGLGLTLARTLLESLYRVDFRPDEVAALKRYAQAAPRSVIYLMNHRSNADYVLAAYVLAEKLALSFAVGEWARVWPLEYLFKSFGSYFIRRGFRDPLYHTVLRRYVQLVTKNAVTQALFPEGGLTRDGRLQAAKIGLLDAILCAKDDRSFDRELVFVPVAVNYDRVLEDRALVAEAREKRPPTSKLAMARHVGAILFGNAWKFSRRRLRKNGIAAVRFGTPVSFDAWHRSQGIDIFALAKEDRRQHIAEFANIMMRKIAALVPATPLCVVAKVLLARAPATRTALVEAVAAESARLMAAGVDVVGHERGALWMLDGALLRFGLRHLVTEQDGVVAVQPEALAILRFYANSIAHHDDGQVPVVAIPEHLQARKAS